MRPELFVGLDRVVVHGGAEVTLTVACPDFAVDRLEISSLTCSAFEVVSLKLGDVSLLEGEQAVMGETFRPGNEARFNRLRFQRQSFAGADVITLVVRNCRASSFELSGTLYGLPNP